MYHVREPEALLVSARLRREQRTDVLAVEHLAQSLVQFYSIHV